jgi:hypothetical protein
MFPSTTNTDGHELTERILIALGGALLTVAPYLTWLRVVIVGDFNLSGLLSAAHSTVAIPYFVTALGVALVLIAVLARSIDTVRVTALTSGSIVLLAGSFATYGLVRGVSNSAGLGQVGPGPIMAVVASVLLIVPPLVDYVRQPHASPIPEHVWRRLSLLPAITAVLIGAAVAWVPFHAGVNNYCGTAVGAALKNPAPLPSSTPPTAVAAQLQQDQAAVTAAKDAVNAQSNADANASHGQSAADTLSAQAQQADTAASNAENTVAGDQSTVSGDQATVDSDQSTVNNDQQTIANDQTTLNNDQQTLASDQQAGNDTTGDQQTIATDQQTLATDQATQAKDQQTVRNDQAALSGAATTLAADQKTRARDQATAKQLDQKAQDAESSAQGVSASTAQQDQTTQQQLSDAQQRLTTDQQNWQATYQQAFTTARVYDTALSSCRSQANGHLITAGVIAAAGIAVTAWLIFRRRRATPDASMA